MMVSMDDKKIKLCGCGCGEPVTQRRDGSYNKFINHHYIRLKNPAQSESFKKRMTGDNNPAKRPEVRKKISKSLKGVYVGDKNHMRQEKYRKMFSDMWTGKKNPMYGKKHSKESREKMSISQKKRPPDSEETRKNKSKSKKGIPKSEEHKKKLSEANIKNKASKGKNNPFYGKRHTEETRKKISEHRKIINGMDETHPLWYEILSPLSVRIRQLVDSKKWRNKIFRRDNYTCKNCKRRGGDLHAHHYKNPFHKIIKDNNIKTIEEAINCKELWDINNGITLCIQCHREKHTSKKI